jgi:F-type H+-transporting ATPase subunit gamma
MARSLRDIRRKMKAVKSTRQVTKAMELVAASKMRKAVQNAQNLSQYAAAAWQILQSIGAVHPGAHPFLEKRELKRVLVVLLTSDRGLCGSLNAQVFREADRTMRHMKGKVELEWAAIGRKGQQFLQRMDQKIVAAFPAYSNHPKFRDIVPVTKLVMESFLNGTYDHVMVIYPQFISALVQKPQVKTLLPLSDAIVTDSAVEAAIIRTHADEYLFEPSARSVLDAILPQLTETQMYQAVLDAAASEHSARMLAMRSATDNATEILDDLTLTYNRTRQANITAELAELSASKAALE